MRPWRPAELRRFDSAEFFGGRATSRGPAAGGSPHRPARETRAFDRPPDPRSVRRRGRGLGHGTRRRFVRRGRDPAADPGSASGAVPTPRAAARKGSSIGGRGAERLYLLSLEVDEETAGAAAGGGRKRRSPERRRVVDAGEHAENVGGDGRASCRLSHEPHP